ncbi:hypothetical protein Y1Q_0007121 [Alligator mississippiensis]|uniref:Uncharacterized protein n=1 Tax=Alligator mississippiensis TaxID=8496 RepID=A0A151N5K6_ALLMI|nr:hypothetical protein Y1Q_0007121 [Alligator mississippiensis]
MKYNDGQMVIDDCKRAGKPMEISIGNMFEHEALEIVLVSKDERGKLSSAAISCQSTLASSFKDPVICCIYSTDVEDLSCTPPRSDLPKLDQHTST